MKVLELIHLLSALGAEWADADVLTASETRSFGGELEPRINRDGRKIVNLE